jgi:hypothetical protein
MAMDNLRWLSTQVQWVPIGTTLSTCRNRTSRKWKYEAIWAQAMYGAQTGQKCGHEREGEDSVRAQMLNRCADGRA